MKKDVANQTKEYYNTHAEAYAAATLGVDMQAAYALFERYLQKGDRILDVGFGSGRDLLYFARAGYRAVGIDNCAAFVASARAAGLEVYEADLHDIQFAQSFNGVWANAVLVHSPDLFLALGNLWKVLKVGGVAYVSLKMNGANVADERYFAPFDEGYLTECIRRVGFSIEEKLETADQMGRDVRWLSLILRKC